MRSWRGLNLYCCSQVIESQPTNQLNEITKLACSTQCKWSIRIRINVLVLKWVVIEVVVVVELRIHPQIVAPKQFLVSVWIRVCCLCFLGTSMPWVDVRVWMCVCVFVLCLCYLLFEQGSREMIISFKFCVLRSNCLSIRIWDNYSLL